MAPSRPNISGFPGRIAICPEIEREARAGRGPPAPGRGRRRWRRRWSPAGRQPPAASAAAAIASAVVARDRQHQRLAAGGADQRRQRMGVGADDAARRRPARRAARSRRRSPGSRRAAAMHREPADGRRRRPARCRAASQAPARPAAARRRPRNPGRARRMCRPAEAASRTVTRSPSRSASSWITIASAPVGHHAAGEDAHRLARADRARERMAGRRLPITRSAAPVAPHPPRAAHSRPWPRRRPAAGCAAPATGRGEHAAQRVGERHDLGRRRPQRRQDARRALPRPRSRIQFLRHRNSARNSPDLPPALWITPHRLDPHAAIDRLAHVIDRQRRDRGRGQRLHLDAGRPGGAHRRRDLDRVAARRRAPARRVTEAIGSGWQSGIRSAGPLGRHDPGEAGDAEHVALGGARRAGSAPASAGRIATRPAPSPRARSAAWPRHRPSPRRPRASRWVRPAHWLAPLQALAPSSARAAAARRPAGAAGVSPTRKHCAPVGGQAAQIGGRADAALGDQEPLRRHVRRQLSAWSPDRSARS